MSNDFRILYREQYRALTDEMIGESDESPGTRVEMSDSHVSIERFDSISSVDVSGSEQATDVRVGNLRIIVGRSRCVVLSHRGTYPVWEWAVLYDGPVVPDNVA